MLTELEKLSSDGCLEASIAVGILGILDADKKLKATNKSLIRITDAAGAGNALAQYIIGTLNLENRLVCSSEAAAYKWFSAASEQGIGRACYWLGVMNLNGIGTTKNEAKAICYFSKAIEENITDARVDLADLLLEKGEVEKSLQLIKLAAESGDDNAMFRLGDCYHKGTGVAKDNEKAMHWYKAAARNGSVGALGLLSQVHRYGLLGNPRDVRLADQLAKESEEMMLTTIAVMAGTDAE